jgi:4-amino-4-deoxy-L-arabinose transferase-like glycosyltransferase
LPYDYREWSANHIWLHKQPVPLWSMALSLFFFGTNEIALRLPSILLSTLAIFLTFKIATLLFGKKTGLIAAFLHAIHGLIIEITGGRVATDHIDLFFLFFIELAVYFALLHSRKRYDWKLLILIGLSIGLAILSKWLSALIVLPIWLLFNNLFKSKPIGKVIGDFFIVLFVIAIIILPWQIYIYSNFPLEANWESSHQVKHIFEGLDGNGQPFYYHFDKLRVLFGELIYLPLLWWFWMSFKKVIKKQNYNWLAITVWVLMPLLFFSFVETKMQAYLLFTAPAIFIITAVFFRYLNFIKPNFKKAKPIVSLIAILLLLLPVRYSIERIKPFSSRERSPQWAADLKALNKIFEGEEKVVVFNLEKPIAAMFYCDNVIAYSVMPDEEMLTMVFEKGYSSYVIKETGEVALLKKATGK